MKTTFLTTIFTILITAAAAFGQTSWLDRPLNNNWNNGSGSIPNAPRSATIDQRCRDLIRTPDSLADRAVTRAGWSLFGAAQTYGAVTVVNAMAGADGMCRPAQFNTFIFVGTRFAGTISPNLMDSRFDGSLVEANLNSPTSMTAQFNRYTSRDALCCPSQTSIVTYSISAGSRPVVKAENVTTDKICGSKEDEIVTQDNIVSGTVTYRQRIALPKTAVVIVKLVDVSRQDVSSATIAERRIETAGTQVPFSFDFAYDQKKIEERNRYALRAEIRDGDTLLFISDTSYPVITQGNPRVADIVVAPVGGGGNTGRMNTVRGTVTYLQRIALSQNSDVTVRLVDSASPEGKPVAENTFSTNGKQVPIPFELQYEARDINRQRNYELQAEIKTDGKLVFKTESGKQVTLRGNQTDGVELVLTQSSEGPEAIKDKSISLSKFGTGTLQIEGRSGLFLINASVNVRTDGTADVKLSGITGGTTFSGKLTYFDNSTLRITVQNSGDADASGEIEVQYSSRSLRSLSGNNLILDGQNVTLKF